MKKENKKNCFHSWEVIEKEYDYFNKLIYAVLFCRLCGKVKRVKIK